MTNFILRSHVAISETFLLLTLTLFLTERRRGMDVARLLKAVGKYKRLFELYHVHPYAYVVNGRSFYLAFYRWDHLLRGNAIISLDKAPKEDYLEAFQWLALFSVFSMKIFELFADRKATSSSLFFDVVKETNHYIQNEKEEFSSSHPLIIGRDIVESLGEWHEALIHQFEQYESYYYDGVLERNVITKRDIDYTMTNMAKLNRLVFIHGKLLYEHTDELQLFLKELHQRKIMKKIPKDSKTFLKRMTKKKATLEKALQQYKLERSYAHLPMEEQISKIKAESYESGFKLVEKMKRKIRNTFEDGDS